MSNWQWLESGLGALAAIAQYNLAQIVPCLNNLHSWCIMIFRYRVDPFANFRVPKDIRKGS